MKLASTKRLSNVLCTAHETTHAQETTHAKLAAFQGGISAVATLATVATDTTVATLANLGQVSLDAPTMERQP